MSPVAPADEAGWRHRVERVGEVRLHLVEAGEGPLVLLVHGFPESWYSWRHQLVALAAAGYRAVAIDVRGYGRSSAPSPVESYRMLSLVSDNVGLVAALGETEAVVVGHDWGAPIAWNTALLRPDVFTAVAGLSVPYSPAGHTRPTEMFAAMARPESEFYINYFQQPGRAEAELELDVRDWLLGFYFTASGDAASPARGEGTVAEVPRGGLMRERFQRPAEMPTWLSDDDLDVYAGEFERTGFTGGLNRYRNVDRDWEDLTVFRGRPIDVPAMFVGGDRDGPTLWGKASIDAFPINLPRLHSSTVLAGCGHWTQQERAAEVNELLLDFLAAVRPR